MVRREREREGECVVYIAPKRSSEIWGERGGRGKRWQYFKFEGKEGQAKSGTTIKAG